jgi:hypothetical protein
VTFAPSSVSSFVDSAMVLCGLPTVHAGSCNWALREQHLGARRGVPRMGPVSTVLYT